MPLEADFVGRTLNDFAQAPRSVRISRLPAGDRNRPSPYVRTIGHCRALVGCLLLPGTFGSVELGLSGFAIHPQRGLIRLAQIPIGIGSEQLDDLRQAGVEVRMSRVALLVLFLGKTVYSPPCDL